MARSERCWAGWAIAWGLRRRASCARSSDCARAVGVWPGPGCVLRAGGRWSSVPVPGCVVAHRLRLLPLAAGTASVCLRGTVFSVVVLVVFSQYWAPHRLEQAGSTTITARWARCAIAISRAANFATGIPARTRSSRSDRCSRVRIVIAPECSASRGGANIRNPDAERTTDPPVTTPPPSVDRPDELNSTRSLIRSRNLSSPRLLPLQHHRGTPKAARVAGVGDSTRNRPVVGDSREHDKV